MRLSQEASEALSNIAIMVGLNVLLYGLIALIFWPMGQLSLAGTLFAGMGWLVVILVGLTLLTTMLEQVFRINEDDHYGLYITLGLIPTVILTLGWSAFLGSLFGATISTTPVWMLVVFYIVGLLSTYLTNFGLVTAFYTGSIYKVTALPLSLVSYLVFAIFPSAGEFLFGWLFG